MESVIEHLAEAWREKLHETVYISDLDRERFEALPYRGRDGRRKHWHRDKAKD